ncbi:shikimate kinase [Eubacterium sp.]|uniref:shikimate kinase n=1 Tax=Eubacterium sp. TaxID=142586 RepID=UPI0025DFC3D2|nr:shikimate kinase [Eubacterium sp.]MCR5629354.1 AAA family ATPase [Eubacterium sp.]
MIFQDNVIKKYLENVYFVSGTPTGGKSTISKALGKKYNIPVYDVDEYFDLHKEMSDAKYQQSMNKGFADADEFFGRTVEEYKNWLVSNAKEQWDFIVLDLIRLSERGLVICDCNLPIEEAECITDPSRIVFLIKNPKQPCEDYCNRPDHQGFSDFIHSATDFEKAKDTVNKTLYSLNFKAYTDIKNSSYFYLERDNNRSVEETARLVEEYLKLDKLCSK